VEGLRFLAQPGMTGIVGNIYTGLDDFEEMGFLLHFLREGDQFKDVGANVGSYTLLAAGICKVNTIALEPIPATMRELSDNLALNHLEKYVKTLQMGAATVPSRLLFTDSADSVLNRVATQSAGRGNLTSVDVLPLDEILREEKITLLKIDVEGYEYPVLQGATRTLENPDLKAVIIELTDYSQRFGYAISDSHKILLQHGFEPYRYDPFQRSLGRVENPNADQFNTIYIRDLLFVRERIRIARKVKVLDVWF
jgi:FkbM family methyltransferase